MKAPIISRKHIVQHTSFTTLASTVTIFRDATAFAVQDVNNANEVIEGSVIKAVYVELWITSKSGGVPGATFVFWIEKASGAAPDPTFTNSTTLDAYINKKNILYTSQGLLPQQAGGNPIPVFRGWQKIPKGKQRFGLGDVLKIVLSANGGLDLAGCGMTIFKSYQ